MTERRHLRRQTGAAYERRAAGVTPAGPTSPQLLAAITDAGSRKRMALTLQASAGNRAVTASLSDIAATRRAAASLAVVGSVASTVAPAAGGVMQIANSATGLRAAGVTSLPAPGAPDVVIGAPLQQTDGTWQATVNATSVTPDTPMSLYPGAGLHDENPTVTGMAVHREVTPAASAEIKAGEEEHLLDLEFARDFAYDRVADAVNRVSASGPITGKSAAEAKQNATDQVRGAVPAQSRWPDGVDPIMHWRRVYGQLVAVTQERDQPNGWHNMSTEIVLDPSAKKKLGVPVSDELLRYRAGTTEVGKHKSGPLVEARYNSLPAGPAATGTQQAPQKPTSATAPAGDYDYKPTGTAYAIRARPPRPKRRD